MKIDADVIRFAYEGVDDIRTLCPDLSKAQIGITDFGSYTTDQFYEDMFRVTRYHSDPELCERLVMKPIRSVVVLLLHSVDCE